MEWPVILLLADYLFLFKTNAVPHTKHRKPVLDLG
jgi:hypothetical protein